MQLTDFLPHRYPMLMLTKLLSHTEIITAQAEIQTDNPFLDAANNLDATALIEIMAQAFAAGTGAKMLQETDTSPELGYLVGLRQIQIQAQAKLGDVLTIEVWPKINLGAMLVVEGKVWREQQCLCSGEFKVYLPTQADPNELA